MAIAIVQVDGSSLRAAATNVASVTAGTNPVTGNYLFTCAAYFNNGGGAVTVTDSTGANTWLKAVESPIIGSNNRSAIWYVKNAGSGAMTVSWNLPSGSYLSGGFLEASGLATSSALDKNSTASGASGSGNVWPANVGDLDSGTLSQADELVIIVVGSGTLSPFTIDALPSGFTTIFSNPSGATYEFGDGNYKIVSATTAVQPQWDFSGTAAAITGTGAIATFKQAGGSSSVIKTFDGLANASTKTVIAVANASVKTFDGVANQ